MAKVIQDERIGKLGKLAVGCSAAVFDSNKRKILLVRRADNGRWAVPGGYMEPGESVAEACAREVLEETGLHVRVDRLIAVYSTPHVLLEYPDGNRLQLVVLHFAAEPIEGELQLSKETTELRYFSREEIEYLNVSDMDRQRITDGFGEQTVALIK
ncbi:MAG: NUDIX domain-containing protein [Chloroflexi bacterium]|nr:NUDIX domain-containing protein [Chloroflexota bacterium]